MGPSGFVRNKLVVGLVACGTIAGLAAIAAPASASASGGRHALPGSTPRWLHSAQRLGATPSGQRVSFGIVLGMRNQAGAVAQLKAISEPGSAIGGILASHFGVTAPFWFAFVGSAIFLVLLWRELTRIAHADDTTVVETAPEVSVG